MSSLKDQILDLRDELMIAKDEGKLTPDGQKMLDQLDLARNSKYDYEYYSFKSDFSTSFDNFVKTLGN